ncbi:MAG: hypothetical protein J0H08_17175 [Rhizobiales bacterium]|nr:hypothetical protein [Hyphomicrobiales bacterium]
MRLVLVSGLLVASAVAAHAELPRLNAVCPDGIAVKVDDAGAVFIDDRLAAVDGSHLDHYEARAGDVTISLVVKQDGLVDVSYAREDGREGVCPTSGSGPL